MQAEPTPFIELKGEFYQFFLEKMHNVYRPSTYLEIGTLNGETLKLSSCSSISIDPNFKINADIIGSKPSCHLYQCPSDAFFENSNPINILGKTVDLSFLDGLHLFEYLLRDFYNVEKFCSNDSIIVMHDCLPGDPYMAVRDPANPLRNKSMHSGYWTGDVWKIIPILQRWRPDVKINIVDAPPTGLVVVRNLDSNNDILKKNYKNIIDEYMMIDLGDYGVEKLHRESCIVPTISFWNSETTIPPNEVVPPEVVGGRIDSLQDKTAIPAKLPGKESLISSFSYVSAHDLAKGALQSKDVDITFEGQAETQTRLSSAPTFHDDPDGVGLFPALTDQMVPHSPLFVASARNVRLAGYRTFLTKDGTFFMDSDFVSKAEVAGFLERLSGKSGFENEETGLMRTSSEGNFELQTQGRNIEKIEVDALSLCSFEPSNYGSFLFRTLPKLATSMIHFKDRAVLAPAYADSMFELLQMAGVQEDFIIRHDPHKIYEFNNVLIPSVRNPHALIDNVTREFYGHIREKFGSRREPKKIFVSRLGWNGSYAANHRVMINEEEVIKHLTSEGFQVVRPHAMTVSQQIRAFSSADIIIGASGSAMFNVVFSHPGTKVVDIESEPNWIFAHQNIFSSCGMKYGIFEAKAQDRDWTHPHKKFDVNIEALMARVRSL